MCNPTQFRGLGQIRVIGLLRSIALGEYNLTMESGKGCETSTTCNFHLFFGSNMDDNKTDFKIT